MSRVLVIGEALMDVVTRTTDGATQSTRHPGGSPANVALGLARLGIPTDFVTSLAPDEDGRTIARHLRGSGVSIADVCFNAERTPRAVATIAADGSPSYEFDVVWQIANAQSTPPADIVHTGSIGAFVQPGAGSVLAAVEARTGSTVSFDPNIRPGLLAGRSAAREQFERFAAISQLVKLSDEDASWLYPGETLQAVREHLFRLGVLLVVVTLGRSGSTLTTDDTSVAIPAASGVRGDTIGAGDSYMAALLAGIIDIGSTAPTRGALAELSRENLLRLGNFAAAAAAVTVSRHGADLPTRDEIRHLGPAA